MTENKEEEINPYLFNKEKLENCFNYKISGRWLIAKSPHGIELKFWEPKKDQVNYLKNKGIKYNDRN